MESSEVEGFLMVGCGTSGELIGVAGIELLAKARVLNRRCFDMELRWVGT